ncbi:MAG: ABC transporter [Oscillospiraceae bacterium]|nr:ABC transporter [Oscillospiraceae bacterium]
MLAIYKRELSSFYKGMFGYIVAGFMLIFAGIYCSAYNLSAGYPAFEYVLSAITFLYMLIVPILTMRSFAEERRQHTDQLLYSLPISMSKVVWGKYLAMLTVLAVPIVIISFYPLILTRFGTVNLIGAYSGLVGYFLLGAALIALGMFVSSLTENQAVAAGLSFICTLLVFMMSTLTSYLPASAMGSYVTLTIFVLLAGLLTWLITKNSTIGIGVAVILEIALSVCFVLWRSAFIGLAGTILQQLSLFDRLGSFLNGMFDLTGVVYDLSFAAVFVFLTVQSLEKRRWS